MLRITRVDRENGIDLRWEGRLTGPWLAEARRTAVEARLSGLPVTIDLTGLIHLEAEGVALARDLHEMGITLTKCSRYVAELLRGVVPC